MNKKFKRFSINKQLITVFVVAVMLPFVIVTLILININQIAVRKEITYGTHIVFEYYVNRMSDTLGRVNDQTNRFLKESFSKNDNPPEFMSGFLNKSYIIYEEVALKTALIRSYNTIINGKRNSSYILHGKTLISIDPWLKMHKVVGIDLVKLMESFDTPTLENNRIVSLFDQQGHLIYSSKKDQSYKTYLREIYQIQQQKPGIVYIFGTKNEPSYASVVPGLPLILIVDTPKDVSHYGTVKSRYRIIMVLVIASLVTMIIGILYSMTLNRNIRQLLKAVYALKSGYYARKIHLIKNILTPYELVYIADEFNVMADTINKAWIDINEKNERLKKLDEVKSNLIDTVSHELRTPLTSIIGLTGSLIKNEDKLTKEIQLKSLKTVKKQAMLLNRMVNDLLVVPEIEHSTLRCIPEFLDIGPIIDSVVNDLHFDKERFLVTVAEDISSVYVDGERLEQVLMNLFTNAFKYSKPDSLIEIIVFPHTTEKNVMIEIYNQSKSIDPGIANHLFDKFARLESADTLSKRGTGLGLFIAKGLMKAMGGDIFLDTSEGFKITLQLPIDNDQQRYV